MTKKPKAPAATATSPVSIPMTVRVQEDGDLITGRQDPKRGLERRKDEGRGCVVGAGAGVQDAGHAK
jgi:hypothetical protein